MTRRAVLTYKPDTDIVGGKGLRLYIRDGIVMNPDTEALITAGLETNLIAVRIRRSGQGVRNLLVAVESEIPA